MISAAFIWEPGQYDAEFDALNAVIESVAVQTTGYIGVELWNSEDGKRFNATYYWRDMQGLRELAAHPRHLEAKQRYAQWYLGYHVVLAEVVKTYGDGAFAHLTAAPRADEGASSR
jgi:heme-degrading monooxygenase HmoA